jgi:hypothetical protein
MKMLEKATSQGLYDTVTKLNMAELPWKGIPSDTYDICACNGVLIYINEARALLRRRQGSASFLLLGSLPSCLTHHKSRDAAGKLPASGYPWADLNATSKYLSAYLRSVSAVV